MLAIIGGSGLSALENLVIQRQQVVRTPYGEPSAALTFGALNGHPVIFLARHGYGHTIPPHEINYRANIWALQAQGVSRIIAVTSVGGIRADLAPSTLVLPDQLIDYTHSRKFTYVEAGAQMVSHLDFTQPYCSALQQRIVHAAEKIGISVRVGGTYGVTQGPRFETAAEVRRLLGDGVDMVGMTGMPEAILAAELGMAYVSLAVVANWAAGIGDSRCGIHQLDAQQVLQKGMVSVRRILAETLNQDTVLASCDI